MTVGGIRARQGKAPVRLFQKGCVLGHRRSKANVYPTCTLLAIDGVRTRQDTKYYYGKKVAYIFKAKTLKKGSKYRVIWGKIRRAHGGSGAVRAKFTKNMPPSSFGNPVRVMMYPSSI